MSTIIISLEQHSSKQRSHRREVGIVPACIVKTIPTNEAVRRLTPRDRGPTSSSCCNVFRTCTLPLMDLIITCQHQQENHPHQSQNTVVLVLSNCNLSSSKPLSCSCTGMTKKSNSSLASIITLVTPFRTCQNCSPPEGGTLNPNPKLYSSLNKRSISYSKKEKMWRTWNARV